MLSISEPSKGSSGGAYYFRYYSKNSLEPGQWFGQGAELLDLSGQVTQADFKSVMKGFHPNGEKLVQNAGSKDRQGFWDLTLSVPKPVSVLWAVAGGEERKEIEACVKSAVTDTLNKVESELGLSRKGKAGKDFVPAALTFAVFFHHTSRSEDPQMHFHCLLMNVGVREDGTTGGIWSKEIFKNKVAIGSFFLDRLGHALEKNLGLEITPERIGFHIEGVPKELCREFSKRRQDIETELAARGHEGGEAAKHVAAFTRDAKRHTPLDVLTAQWRKTAQSHRFGPDTVAELLQSKKHAINRGTEQQAQTNTRQPAMHGERTPNAERVEPQMPPKPQQPHQMHEKEDRSRESEAVQKQGQSKAESERGQRDREQTKADSQAKEQEKARGEEKQRAEEMAAREKEAKARQEKAHRESQAKNKAKAQKKKQERSRRRAESKKHRIFAKALREAVDRIFPENQTRERVLRLAYKMAQEFKVDPKLIAHFVDDLKLPHHGKLYRVEWRKMAKRAPKWSPLSAQTPRIVLRNIPRKWDRVLWRKDAVKIGKPTHEIRVQMRKLFPKAPGWSPASKLALPAVRFAKKQKPLPRPPRNLPETPTPELRHEIER